MDPLLTPLTEAELAELDRFLHDHAGADEAAGPTDAIASVFELDGLFAALVSGPQLVAPEQWMPVVWGSVEPEWDSEDAFDHIVGLMLRHLNTMAATLAEASAEFVPLFLQDEEDGEEFLIVDDWCEGYVRGVRLSNAQWRAGGKDIEKLLNPIRAFSSATNWRAYDLPDAELDRLSDAITTNARAIHAFWAGRRA